MSAQTDYNHELPTPGSLLASIKVEFGPPAIIGRALLEAEQAAAARGVYLSFATFDKLLEVNAENNDSWKPLVGVFDPRMGTLKEENAFCVLGRNEAGDVVATQAARFYDWSLTTFYDEATSLRFAYPDPIAQKRDGERCELAGAAPHGVTGRVVFSGGAWYHPDYRKRDLGTILPRISRACALARWGCDWVMSLQAEAVYRGGFARRAGFTLAEPGVRWVNSALGTTDFVLVWMGRSEIVSDLAEFAEGLSVDGRGQVGSTGA